MLALSCYLSFSVITSLLPSQPSYRRPSTIPCVPLLFIPYATYIIHNNCILIHLWFYNQFLHPLKHFRFKSSVSRPQLRHRKHTKYHVLRLLLFINAISQFSLVAAVYQHILPISSLTVFPSACIIYFSLTNIRSIQSNDKIEASSTTIKNFSSNREKLAYLTAWHSIQQSNHSIMNFTPGGKPICIDTGASSCISNDKADFIILVPSENTVLQGISSGLNIEGSGTICWNIINDSGDIVTLHIHNSLYVPRAPMCLLSPQSVLQQTKRSTDGFQVFQNKGIFTFAGHKKTICYNQANNLPIFFTATDLSKTNNLSTPYDKNSRVSAFLMSIIQRKLLQKHHQMGHLHMSRIQDLARQGFFGITNKNLANCDAPLCKACIHGKQHKRPIPAHTMRPIDASDLSPGDCISGDQLESTHPGQIPVYKGKPSTDAYHAGTLLVDHASRFLHFTPHKSTGATEAVQAKRLFELKASTFNRHIKRYHGDNGVFTTKLFKDSCIANKQQYTFCGVDAHHQNGIAERYICTVTEHARTMLIHAMLSWPDIITEDLWPYAVQLAVDIHNITPTSTGLSPQEIFSGVKSSFDFSLPHPFGCPIYVLEPTLRQNHKIPRWKPRSRVGVYIGFSPHHASSVPLVLSTTTGLVSPQFHVVFDDTFSTITSFHTNQIPTNWPELFNNSAISYVDEDFNNTNLYDSSFFDSSPNQREYNISSHTSSSENMPESISSSNIVSSPNQGADTTKRVHFSTEPPEIFHNNTSNNTPHDGWNSSHKYNTRFRLKHSANTAIPAIDSTYHDPLLHEFFSHHDINPLTTPQCFQSTPSFSSTNPIQDILHFRDMIKDADCPHFEKDMCRKIDDLLASNTITVVPRSIVPCDNTILQAIWSFRRKRAPDWSVLKHKARLCPHGGMQIEGINYWDTYAPVIDWRTVRLTLILSLLSGLKSRQVDYVSAYTQAPLDCELYMNIPPGFVVNNGILEFSNASTKGNSTHYVLRLNKNVYGLKQAGNNWFTELRGSLLALNFKQSSHDPCLFIRGDCLIIIYVDDCLFFAKTDDVLDTLLQQLRSKFNLVSQNDIGAFLGIDIQRTSEGILELTQPGLIGKIISFVGLEHESNEHKTPATSILHADLNGSDREHT